MSKRFHWWKKLETDLIRKHYGPLSPEPLPFQKIAEMIGCPPEYVRSAARRLGLCFRSYTKMNHDKAMALYSEKQPDRIIAFRLDVTRKTVSLWRKKNNLPSVAAKGRKKS